MGELPAFLDQIIRFPGSKHAVSSVGILKAAEKFRSLLKLLHGCLHLQLAAAIAQHLLIAGQVLGILVPHLTVEQILLIHIIAPLGPEAGRVFRIALSGAFAEHIIDHGLKVKHSLRNLLLRNIAVIFLRGIKARKEVFEDRALRKRENGSFQIHCEKLADTLNAPAGVDLLKGGGRHILNVIVETPIGIEQAVDHTGGGQHKMLGLSFAKMFRDYAKGKLDGGELRMRDIRAVTVLNFPDIEHVVLHIGMKAFVVYRLQKHVPPAGITLKRCDPVRRVPVGIPDGIAAVGYPGDKLLQRILVQILHSPAAALVLDIELPLGDDNHHHHAGFGRLSADSEVRPGGEHRLIGDFGFGLGRGRGHSCVDLFNLGLEDIVFYVFHMNPFWSFRLRRNDQTPAL